jgi:lysophospholipase L1-like esterase
LLLTALSLAVAGSALRAEDSVDLLESVKFTPPKEKGRLESISGREGAAHQFTFDQDAKSAFFTSRFRGQPDWDKADGFSFWVKGDGSKSFGGLQFIYDDDFAVRYDYLFPIDSTEWQKITVAWSDLIPVLPGTKSLPLGSEGGNPPAKLSAMWVGKWWYWREYPACTFAIDGFRLEPKIERDAADHRPAGPPLARVLAKLKAGQPITIVTMGDSLTDFRHWSNRQDPWPKLVAAALTKKYGSEVTLHNPAIGGTQLRLNLVLAPRWLAEVPEPDLVTIAFGYNDWDAGMRGEPFRAAYIDAVNRIRRATGGKADVLILTTTPALERWTTMQELAQACRDAAQDRNAGLADTEKAFWAAGEKDRINLFGFDKVHLGPEGHKVVAEAVLAAIEQAK